MQVRDDGSQDQGINVGINGIGEGNGFRKYV